MQIRLRILIFGILVLGGAGAKADFINSSSKITTTVTSLIVPPDDGNNKNIISFLQQIDPRCRLLTEQQR